MYLAFLAVGIPMIGFGLYLHALWRSVWREHGMRHVELKPQDRLVTRGIYAHVRHPHYLSNMVVASGISLVIFSVFQPRLPLAILPFLPSLILIPVEYWIAIREERDLLKKFGTEYRDYMDRVPRIIPKLTTEDE